MALMDWLDHEIPHGETPMENQSAILSDHEIIIQTKEHDFMSMSMTLAVMLIILWLLGLLTGITMGGIIHILLAVAIVIILAKEIQELHIS